MSSTSRPAHHPHRDYTVFLLVLDGGRTVAVALHAERVALAVAVPVKHLADVEAVVGLAVTVAIIVFVTGRGGGAIARARGMVQLAKDTGLTREGLYKALSKDGNPSLGTVLKVLKALGLKFTPQVA